MFRYIIQVWFREKFRAPFFAAVITVVTMLLLPHGAAAAPADTFCTPDQVVVFTNAPRLHVHCAAAVGGISYFAISTSDQAQAARVLSVISTALIAGRTLVIRYDQNDLSGAAIGCLNSDCRLIQAVGFGK